MTNISYRTIAQHAGVSPASVSRYFNRTEPLSEELTRKIEQALEELDYSGKPRTDVSETVLVLISRLDLFFYSEALRTLLGREPDSYNFIIMNYQPGQERQLEEIIRRQHPIGVMYFEEEIGEPTLEMIRQAGLRTVMCGGIAVDRGSDMVRTNDLLAAYDGTRYLLGLGHKRILFLSDESSKIGAGFQRIAGSRKALEEEGLDLLPGSLCTGSVTYESGYRHVQQVLAEERDFSAIFAFSDEMAIGALNALKDAGIRVPEDVSLLGYDDLSISAKVRPALTTVHQPMNDFIEKSIEILSTEDSPERVEILLPHRIVERDSCRRVN